MFGSLIRAVLWRILFLTLLALKVAPTTATNFVDIVTPVARKDATIYRFNLRHVLKHVQNVRHVYVVCQPSVQMRSIVLHANLRFTKQGQRVILVDEAVFPFNFDTIRAFLRESRPTSGFDGKPFEGKVVTPRICPLRGPGMPDQYSTSWIQSCRMPFMNETTEGGTKYCYPKRTNKFGDPVCDKVQSWERTGWLLQQFLKLGCSPEFVPGIGEHYLVIDADTLFMEDYSVFPADGKPSQHAVNFIPGDTRDCGNPPYFMTLRALGIKMWGTQSLICAGHAPNRKCSKQMFCPIAHGMVYSQSILEALRAHLETRFKDAKGGHVQWWQAILQEMPVWHTSPFSEYITYYAFALERFPSRVRIYDAVQMGASEQEIAPNYYMSNGLGISKVCDLTGFAVAKSFEDRSKHRGAAGYCDFGNGRAGALEFYKPELHGGAACPAPKCK